MILPKVSFNCDNLELAKRAAKLMGRPLVCQIAGDVHVYRVSPSGRCEDLTAELEALKGKVRESVYGSQGELGGIGNGANANVSKSKPS